MFVWLQNTPLVQNRVSGSVFKIHSLDFYMGNVFQDLTDICEQKYENNDEKNQTNLTFLMRIYKLCQMIVVTVV